MRVFANEHPHPYSAAELREERAEYAPGRSRDTQQILEVSVQRGNDLEQRAERGGRGEWITRADVHVRATTHRLAELLDHRAFADARLAADECQAALTRVSGVAQGLQLLERQIALEELHNAALWRARL